MEQKRAPVQPYYLLKSFVIMFMIQAVLVLFTPQQLIAQIWYQILVVNLVVAGVLGWFLYKQWYHIVLSYDEAGFRLQKGKNPPVSRKWSEFSQVSLARNEYGEYNVRLHSNGDHVEIPVSKLKLEPSQFRLQAIEFVARATSPSK